MSGHSLSPTSARESAWKRAIYALSAVICLTVAFLILGPRPPGVAGQWNVSFLPLVNASLNGLTGLLLIAGFVAIKTRRIKLHKGLMISAFGVSSLFLISYVTYHWFSEGPTRYEGDFRAFYLVILVSHILLATVILPLALITLYRGWTSSLQLHRRIARITLPLWLYVSASGVAIFVMLYL